MRQNLLILIVVVVAVILLGSSLLIGRTAKTELSDGPSPTITAAPTTGGQTATACDAIRVVAPVENDMITSPVTVEVIIDNRDSTCKWTVFEAVAGSVAIEDSAGRVLGTDILTTEGEWMTEGPVTYTADFEFEASGENPVNLVIRETNPSGDESQDSTITIPVQVGAN